MTLNETLKSQTVDIDSRVDKCLSNLRSVIFSVSSEWSSDLKTGWREFPDKTSKPSRLSLDLWSTSQALEILSSTLANFRINGYAFSPEIENKSKEAIIAGVDLLLQSSDARSRLQLNKPISSLGLGRKIDVIGLVWQLRAISQVLKASKVLSLPISTELLFQKGEALLRDLFILQDPNGGWSAFGEVGKSSYVTGMVVWTIAESYPVFKKARYLRPHKVHGTHIAVEWLLKNRIQKSGIPFFEGGGIPSVSRTAVTSIAIWARHQLKCPEPIPEIELAINNAWILERQDSTSGGWSDNLEEGAKPDVEVTALALLALLKSGANPTHPSIVSAVDWMLSSFRTEDDSRSGWGIDPDSSIRIWTSWYATLALWEFIFRSKKPRVKSLNYQVTHKPKLIFLQQGGEKKVKIRLHVQELGNAWAYLRIKEPDAGVELKEPIVVKLQEPKSNIYLKLHQLKKGFVKCTINLCDLSTGTTSDIPIRIMALGKFCKSILSTLASPKNIVISLATSSALYAFFKYGNKITKELAFDLLSIGLGAIPVILIFAYFRYLSGE